MTLSLELAALRDKAMQTSCESWAMQKRWPLSKGVDRAGPCPVCGGSDRFAIHIEKNAFLCRQCGISGGGVIDLVMKTENVEFVRACEIITGQSASAPIDPASAAEFARQAERDRIKRKDDAERYREAARADAYKLWETVEDPTPQGSVVAYMLLRGLGGGRIDFLDPNWFRGTHIRSLAKHPYYHEGKPIHAGPAMPACIRAPDGSFAGVHQTWIDIVQEKGKVILPFGPKGKVLPAKKVRGLKKGGAVRLHTPASWLAAARGEARTSPGPLRLVMGEGIETTLTPFVHAFEEDTAYWAGVDLGNMSGKAARTADGAWLHDQPDMDDLECFLPPDWCEELTYLSECDEPEKHTLEKVTRGLLRAKQLRDDARAKGADLPPLAINLVEPIGGSNDLNDLVRS